MLIERPHSHHSQILFLNDFQDVLISLEGGFSLVKALLLQFLPDLIAVHLNEVLSSELLLHYSVKKLLFRFISEFELISFNQVLIFLI